MRLIAASASDCAPLQDLSSSHKTNRQIRLRKLDGLKPSSLQGAIERRESLTARDDFSPSHRLYAAMGQVAHLSLISDVIARQWRSLSHGRQIPMQRYYFGIDLQFVMHHAIETELFARQL
jgi:hypothetical protein